MKVKNNEVIPTDMISKFQSSQPNTESKWLDFKKQELILAHYKSCFSFGLYPYSAMYNS